VWHSLKTKAIEICYCQKKVSNTCARAPTHTHTHTHTYIYEKWNHPKKNELCCKLEITKDWVHKWKDIHIQSNILWFFGFLVSNLDFKVIWTYFVEWNLFKCNHKRETVRIYFLVTIMFLNFNDVFQRWIIIYKEEGKHGVYVLSYAVAIWEDGYGLVRCLIGRTRCHDF
jgi:hypothetical protein